MWMQKIKLRDGTFKRAFCLPCLKEGKPWIGGELCDHFQHAVNAGPASQLEKPIIIIDENEKAPV
jgi:hypothetical protein